MLKTTRKIAVVMTTLCALAIGTAVAGDKGKDKAQGSDGKVPIFALAEKAGLKTLATAVKAAGLQETLTTGGPFTVFAPTDSAFAALPAGALDNLLKNPEELKKVLLYHVVAGEVKAGDVVKLTEATTVNGQKVTVNAAKGVKINDATVVQADVLAKNGVVHVIDKVLLPK